MRKSADAGDRAAALVQNSCRRTTVSCFTLTAEQSFTSASDYPQNPPHFI